jgi:hypothetical protein
MHNSKRKMKLLATKLSALQSEITVSREIIHHATSEVEKIYAENYKTQERKPEPKKKSIRDRVNKFKENPQVETSKKASDDVRKAFKKIASQCHPDKLQDIEDEAEKEKKQELYQRARKALEDDDIFGLSSVADDLGIEVPEITAEQIREAEKKIVAIKKELEMIESTAVWFWYFTEEPTKKEKILEELLDEMHKRRNPGA